MDDRDEFGIDLRRRNDRPRFRCKSQSAPSSDEVDA